MEYNFDEENGIILDKATGDRCIILTKARMGEILTRITDIFQSSAQVIINEICKSAGERYVDEVIVEKKSSAIEFLTLGVQRFTDAGYGRVEVVEFKPEPVEVTLRLWDNFFAEIPNGDSTFCSCVEAFLAGMYKGFLGKTPKIKETKCKGKKDPYCEWHISP
jgi:predicted hydrocarbon binding protein